MIILLLALLALVGLVLTIFSLPGLWIFLLLAAGLKAIGAASGLTWGVWLVGIGLAAVAEGVEWVASMRYTRRYGGSRRAAWGALIGGMIGAVMGLPVPVIGSILGSFAGSFLGALILEFTASGDQALAGRAAWGSVVGRVVATAFKVMIGVVVGVLVVGSAAG
jgi:hypothetical protein